MVNSYAAFSPCKFGDNSKKWLGAFEYNLPDLKPNQVRIAIDYCGICHSDLSMLANDWMMSQYPFVAGHEIVGKVAESGSQVQGLKIGDAVGVGWFSGSCLSCQQCREGDLNLCAGAEQTIVGRPGGFADTVQVNSEWVIKLPTGEMGKKIDLASAGPLFCGGLTVFSPILECGVRPTDRVGVIGIGGLGHLAIQYLNAWGCEVTAFTSNRAKSDEIKRLGADYVVSSNDPASLKNLQRSLDFIISTVNVPLDWMSIISTLRPRGKLHFVGAVPVPISVQVFPLIQSQISVSASPLGSPANAYKMLEFVARHSLNPVAEEFALSDVNSALAHLHSGKAKYRVVLNCKK
jgi:alcohol/geraniol dehydrogenase (NADP+)